MDQMEARKLLKCALAQLSEHFDGVQILASWQSREGTHFGAEGAGNWYLRQGMARMWVERDQAETNADRMREAIHPPDDGDEWKAP